MKINRYAYLVLTTIFYSTSLFAQIKITGKIADTNHKPIDLAEVILLTKDSVAVKSELSDEQGNFQLDVKQGSYRVQIKQLGKILYRKAIAVETKDIDLGTIQVAELQHQLKEVVVSSNKKLIERKVDRLVFNVENSISATGGDALDALKVTPNISVQADKIAMIGKSGMLVMVDDRLIKLSGDDLINYLKTISSDNIKSIEVISTPPAKYDAEGNSGLINIKLKKAKKDSWNNTIRSAYRQAIYPSLSLGNNFTYQKGRLGLLMDISAGTGNTVYTNNINYNYPVEFWKSDIYIKTR